MASQNQAHFSNGIQNINPLQIDAQYKPFLQSWVKGLLVRIFFTIKKVTICAIG
jgi:hypothetical protein